MVIESYFANHDFVCSIISTTFTYSLGALKNLAPFHFDLVEAIIKVAVIRVAMVIHHFS